MNVIRFLTSSKAGKNIIWTFIRAFFLDGAQVLFYSLTSTGHMMHKKDLWGWWWVISWRDVPDRKADGPGSAEGANVPGQMEAKLRDIKERWVFSLAHFAVGSDPHESLGYLLLINSFQEIYLLLVHVLICVSPELWLIRSSILSHSFSLVLSSSDSPGHLEEKVSQLEAMLKRLQEDLQKVTGFVVLQPQDGGLLTRFFMVRV